MAPDCTVSRLSVSLSPLDRKSGCSSPSQIAFSSASEGATTTAFVHPTDYVHLVRSIRHKLYGGVVPPRSGPVMRTLLFFISLCACRKTRPPRSSTDLETATCGLPVHAEAYEDSLEKDSDEVKVWDPGASPRSLAPCARASTDRLLAVQPQSFLLALARARCSTPCLASHSSLGRARTRATSRSRHRRGRSPRSRWLCS